MIKKSIKKNKRFYNFLSDTREKLRIIYNTKTRSRFLWMLVDGDNKLSLNYPLTKNSIVFDVGAYKGNFTKKVYDKFLCYVYAFEPIKESVEHLNMILGRYSKITIFDFGLSGREREEKISNIGAASSLFSRPEGELNETIQLKSFSNFIEENNIKQIDLLYMNIEGAEYELLNEIIDKGFINNISHIQIQFHNFVPNSKKERKNIRKKLKITHECRFNYPFIWERWDIKEKVNK